MASRPVRDPVGDHLLTPQKRSARIDRLPTASLKVYRGVDHLGTKSVVSPIQARDGAARVGAAGQEVMQRAGPPGQRDLVVAT
jgi:hypothetical protein